MSTNVCGRFVMAPIPVLISLGIVVSCPTKNNLDCCCFFPPQNPKFTAIKKAQFGVSSVRSFLVFVSLSYIMIFLVSLPRWRSRSSSGFPRVLWFKRAPSSGGKENTKRRLLCFPLMSERKTKNKNKTLTCNKLLPLSRWVLWSFWSHSPISGGLSGVYAFPVSLCMISSWSLLLLCFFRILFE